MKMTYIGMNNGGIHEAHRLIESLRETRDMLEDSYMVGNYIAVRELHRIEREELASLRMVMRCDAVRAHLARPVSPRLPSGAYLIEQGDDYAVFGGVIL